MRASSWIVLWSCHGHVVTRWPFFNKHWPPTMPMLKKRGLDLKIPQVQGSVGILSWNISNILHHFDFFSIFLFKLVLHQVRRKGNMASMSGADDAVYLEKKGGRQGTFRSIKSDVIRLRRVIVLMWNFRQETHPLFKRFRMAKWWRRLFNAIGVGWHPTGTGGGDHLLGHPYIAHLKSRIKIGP